MLATIEMLNPSFFERRAQWVWALRLQKDCMLITLRQTISRASAFEPYGHTDPPMITGWSRIAIHGTDDQSESLVRTL